MGGWGGREGGVGVLKNEQGQTKGEGGGSKLGSLERTYFLNAPYVYIAI